jgi:hypothetical protein
MYCAPKRLKLTYILAGRIPATTPAVGKANAKPFDFTYYGQLGQL